MMPDSAQPVPQRPDNCNSLQNRTTNASHAEILNVFPLRHQKNVSTFLCGYKIIALPQIAILITVSVNFAVQTAMESKQMERRVTRLETDVGHMQEAIQEIKSDIREFKKEARMDFRLLFGAIVTTTLGLALLIARGFAWL